jgi:hypothetical protein
MVGLVFCPYIQNWVLHCFTLPMTMNCFKKGYIYHINSYFGKGKMYMLFMEFCKCVCICVKTYWNFSRSNPNAMFVAYAIVKTPHDELSICYITFAYVYNKLFTFISLHNNWIVLLGNVFVVGICELYIVQCKLGGDMWIFTNIQW